MAKPKPGDIDYTRIILPDNSDYKTWKYPQRRAMILSEVMKKLSNPNNINVREQMDRYQVSDQTIYNDIDAIKQFLRTRRGDDKDLFIDWFYENSLKELKEDYEEGKLSPKDYHNEKRQLFKNYKEWLQESDAAPKTADKLDIGGGMDNDLNITIKLIEGKKE